MDQNNNNNQSMNNNPDTGAKTFTQEDVNRIVSERLAKEKNKGDAAFAEREREFAERERQLANREALFDLKDQLKEMGLPNELLTVLNVQDKEALNKALDALKSYIDDNNKHKVQENKLQMADRDLEDSLNSQIRKAMHLS